MMQSMRASDEEKAADAWQRLPDILHVDRAVIDAVRKYADQPRHGRPSNITDGERQTIRKMTDEIVRRYLHYLLGGKNKLDATKFPQLKA